MDLLFVLHVHFDEPTGIAEIAVVADSELDARHRAALDTNLPELYHADLAPAELVGPAAPDQVRVQVTYR